jgi:sugar/nucleoside kinase (ribokinase family)
MSTPATHVVAIGNAIVDIIAKCDDAFLKRHDVAKGSMRLIDADTVVSLYKDMGPGIEISGGSAANTMVGIASFGGKSAFIGKVADDEFGRIFAHDLKAAGVAFNTLASAGGAPTARSMILVTPDGERTMNTFLGVSPELTSAEVNADLIKSSGIVYLEGYLFDRPEAKAAFRQAADIAKKAGRQVALTLSDAFCVDRHRDEFRDLVKNHVNILFANESEIKSLYQSASFEDAAKAARELPLAVLTRGAKGAVIQADGRTIKVSAVPVAKVIDTTGAGDLYAAGFLFGVATGRDLETAGRLGALAASEIISHVGARPATPLAQLAKSSGLL